MRLIARIVQSPDSLQVLLTRWLPQLSVEIALIREMVKSASTPVRAATLWEGDFHR